MQHETLMSAITRLETNYQEVVEGINTLYKNWTDAIETVHQSRISGAMQRERAQRESAERQFTLAGCGHGFYEASIECQHCELLYSKLCDASAEADGELRDYANETAAKLTEALEWYNRGMARENEWFMDDLRSIVEGASK